MLNIHDTIQPTDGIDNGCGGPACPTANPTSTSAPTLPADTPSVDTLAPTRTSPFPITPFPTEDPLEPCPPTTPFPTDDTLDTPSSNPSVGPSSSTVPSKVPTEPPVEILDTLEPTRGFVDTLTPTEPPIDSIPGEPTTSSPTLKPLTPFPTEDPRLDTLPPTMPSSSGKPTNKPTEIGWGGSIAMITESSPTQSQEVTDYPTESPIYGSLSPTNGRSSPTDETFVNIPVDNVGIEDVIEETEVVTSTQATTSTQARTTSAPEATTKASKANPGRKMMIVTTSSFHNQGRALPSSKTSKVFGKSSKTSVAKGGVVSNIEEVKKIAHSILIDTGVIPSAAAAAAKSDKYETNEDVALLEERAKPFRHAKTTKMAKNGTE